MTKYNFINQNWKNDVIESFQWRPSKCDTVLKCDDGQVYLSMISLAVASRFWRNIFSDLGIQSERTVILIPDFNKDTVLQILEFLKKGELTTECCPKIIDFTKVLVPEIEIEKKKNSGKVHVHLVIFLGRWGKVIILKHFYYWHFFTRALLHA